MRQVLSLLLIIVWAGSAQAQETKSFEDWLQVLSYGVGNQMQKTEMSYEEAGRRSAHCLPEDFTKATLQLSNGSSFENIFVKYDYKAQLLLIDHEGKVIIAAANFIHGFTFTSASTPSEFINVNQLGRSYDRTGFYEVLLKEQENILTRYRYFESNIDRPQYKATASQTQTKEIADTTFFKKEKVFIYKKQKLYPLDNFNTKSLKILTDNFDVLKDFIKEEKLKFKKEEDLKKFAAFFWSI